MLRKRINKKILIVGNYPIREPRHGGQKRVRAIFEHYSKYFHEVKHVAIFHRGLYPFNENEDILLGDLKLIEKIDNNQDEIDLLTGKSLLCDVHVKSELARLLTDYQPDIVQVEHPFSYPGLKQILIDLGLRPTLIYSSHNIEYRMKKEVLKQKGRTESFINRVISETKRVELTAASEATLVVSVAEEDAVELRKMGARHVAVAPNGIEKLSLNTSAKDTGLILFVSSSHPPNVNGFLEMMGNDMSFLPHSTTLNIVGSCSGPLKLKLKSQNATTEKNIIFHGEVDEEKLKKLLAEAELIILPITQGGGSNLKTAEAILADKKVVATNFALRSYEAYEGLPNIYKANTRKDFRGKIVKALNKPKIKRTKEEELLAQQVVWDNCLEPLTPAVKRASRQSVKELIRKKAVKIKNALNPRQ